MALESFLGWIRSNTCSRLAHTEHWCQWSHSLRGSQCTCAHQHLQQFTIYSVMNLMCVYNPEMHLYMNMRNFYIYISLYDPARSSLPAPLVWPQNLRVAAFRVNTWYLKCFLHGGWLAPSTFRKRCLPLKVYSLGNRSDICLYLLPGKLSLRDP